MKLFLLLLLLFLFGISLSIVSSSSVNIEDIHNKENSMNNQEYKRKYVDHQSSPSSNNIIDKFPPADEEKLPAFSYINRTIYPTVHKYDGSNGQKGKPDLSIGIISDVQYADKKVQQRRHFRKSAHKLRQAVDEMNANRTHLDFVMHLGDLVDHSMHVNGPPMLRILARLNYPVYHVLGNHDYLNAPEEKLDEIPKFLNMPRNYYSMLAGKDKRYRLIILDGNDLSTYATKRGSPKRKQSDEMLGRLAKLRAKHGKEFNGGVGDEQLTWLKQQLGEACRMNQRAVVFLHQGLRPEGERTNLWNDFVVVQTISTFHCLVAVINGHAHKFLYDFKYTMFRQVHFITFGGMVQSPFTSFGFADFYEDELHLHGLIFGRQIEYRLNLSMHQKKKSNENEENPAETTTIATTNKKNSRLPIIVSPKLTREEQDVAVDEGATKFDGVTLMMMMSPSTTNDDLAVFGNNNSFLVVFGFSGVMLLWFVWWLLCRNKRDNGGRKK